MTNSRADLTIRGDSSLSQIGISCFLERLVLRLLPGLLFPCSLALGQGATPEEALRQYLNALSQRNTHDLVAALAPNATRLSLPAARAPWLFSADSTASQLATQLAGLPAGMPFSASVAYDWTSDDGEVAIGMGRLRYTFGTADRSSSRTVAILHVFEREGATSRLTLEVLAPDTTSMLSPGQRFSRALVFGDTTAKLADAAALWRMLASKTEIEQQSLIATDVRFLNESSTTGWTIGARARLEVRREFLSATSTSALSLDRVVGGNALLVAFGRIEGTRRTRKVITVFERDSSNSWRLAAAVAARAPHRGENTALPVLTMSEAPTELRRGPWRALAEDAPNDGARLGFPDARSLAVRLDSERGWLWFRLEVHGPLVDSLPAASITLDVDGDSTNGASWYGSNSAFRYDLILNFGAVRRVARTGKAIGYNGITTADGAVHQDWLDFKRGNLRFHFDRAGRAYFVGVPIADLGVHLRIIRVIGSVGAAAQWNDDVPETGYGTVVLPSIMRR